MTTTTARPATPPVPPAPADADGSTPLTHRQILVVLSGLLIGMFLAALDQTIVSTAMRTIADDLQGQTAQAWVTTAYLITATITTPLYGKLSDTYGRKRPYLVAIVAFIIGSVLCGTASGIYELATYRAVQGIGAGGLVSLVFAIVGDIVPPRERGRYQAYIMSVFASASVLGPVLGGVLAGQGTLLGVDGWRWIFYVNVPIGLLALAVVATRLHLPVRRSDQRIDYVGAALLALAVVPLLLVAERGRELGWGSPTSLLLLALALTGLGSFVPWERRMGEAAILPLRVFSGRTFPLLSVVTLLLGTGMFGSLVLLPLYLQIVRGYSPITAGLLNLPIMVGVLVSGAVSGRVMSRTGRYKIFPVIGIGLMLAALTAMGTLTVDTPMPRVMVYMVVFGAGLGLSMQMLVIAAQNALPPRDMGVATSSVAFFRTLGGTFGVALTLAVLFSTVADNIRARGVAAGLPQAVLDRFGETAALDDTSVIATLPAAVQRVVLEGFADSMSTAFHVVAVVLVPAFFLAMAVKEIPLRESAGTQTVLAERAAAPTA